MRSTSVTPVCVLLAGIAAIGVTLRAQDITSQDLIDGLANPARWLTYSGDYTSQRHSPLTQITASNAGQLAAQWTFQTNVPGKFETTPIVSDGTLYVSGVLNHAWAIDGRPDGRSGTISERCRRGRKSAAAP